jgi:hypothetical protein
LVCPSSDNEIAGRSCEQPARELERTGKGKQAHERIVNALREHIAALKEKVG